MSPVPFGELTTPGGYAVGEVASALQKCVRRGMDEDAVFWATELDLAGYGNYVFKRLTIMASEDIGLADPMATVIVRTLHQNWLDQRKNKADKGNADRLYLVHAVLYCARTWHSRQVDHATVLMYAGPRPKREIPDVALDKHTKRGRLMGRGFEHFFEEGAQLVNVPLELIADPFEQRAIDVLVKHPVSGSGAVAQMELEEGE